MSKGQVPGHGMTCPVVSCGALLQPLQPSSAWVPRAIEHAAAMRVDAPVHGPAALRWCALVAHAMVIHDQLPLAEYLEAYLEQ